MHGVGAMLARGPRTQLVHKPFAHTAAALPGQGITYCAGALAIAPARDSLLQTLCGFTLTNPDPDVVVGGADASTR